MSEDWNPLVSLLGCMGRTTFGLDWAESYLLQEDARPYQLIQRKEGSSIAGDICEALPPALLDLLGEEAAAALDEPVVHAGVGAGPPPGRGVQGGAEGARVGHGGEAGAGIAVQYGLRWIESRNQR